MYRILQVIRRVDLYFVVDELLLLTLFFVVFFRLNLAGLSFILRHVDLMIELC